ncbi:beta-glucosidase 11 isoform X2 [Ricinus communis]|uniref:beta-glucosidase 11 isoform X2 n=1 Tax=Ricinus communis TaxID=3988 RepID=UPI00201B1679|nr:beta-glucosidase 11 isoform X2 [Ricinus communis]
MVLQGKKFGFIGINLFVYGVVPLTNSREDVLATQRANDFFVGLIMNPLVFGDYPDTVKKNGGIRLPVFTNYECRMVKGSFDFLGVNHYSTIYVKDNSDTLKSENRDFLADMAVKIVYGMPASAHENPRDSSLEDIPRVTYIHSYMGSLLDAVRNGSNARGYFTWSFLDVFELIDGYNSIFGLYYGDLEDPELKRYPKLSAHWYSHFLKGGSVSSDKFIQLGKDSSLLSKNRFFQ